MSRVVSLGLLIVLALAGCQTPQPPQPPQPVPDAQQILRYPLVSSRPLTLDPAYIVDPASATVASLVFPSLVTLDAQLRVHLWAADSVQVSADGLTLTFHLRPQMRFTDGEAITAQTFALNLNRALDPCVNAPQASYLYAIAGAAEFNHEGCFSQADDLAQGPISTLVGAGRPLDAPDAQTLIITLEHPDAGFLTTLTMPIALAAPLHLLSAYGAAQWTARLTDNGGLGGNLFRLAQTPQSSEQTGGQTSQRQEYRLTRNPDFWSAATHLREIDFYLYPTAQQAYTGYQSGALDVGFSPVAPTNASSSKTSKTPVTPLLRLTYLGLNWSVAPLSNLGLRQALALAIDKQLLATQTLHGAVLATNHLIPQGDPGYNPALVGPDSTQNLTGNHTLAVKLANTFASENCEGSLALCPAMTLEIPANDAATAAVAAQIAQMWQAVAPGYPLAVRPEPAATLAHRVSIGAAQLYLGVWTAAYPDPEDWLVAPFGHAASGVGASVSSPSVETLLKQANAEQDVTQRTQDFQAAEQLLVNAVAWIPLYQAQLFWQARPEVANIVVTATGGLAIYDTVPSIEIMRMPTAT